MNGGRGDGDDGDDGDDDGGGSRGESERPPGVPVFVVDASSSAVALPSSGSPQKLKDGTSSSLFDRLFLAPGGGFCGDLSHPSRLFPNWAYPRRVSPYFHGVAIKLELTRCGFSEFIKQHSNRESLSRRSEPVGSPHIHDPS